MTPTEQNSISIQINFNIKVEGRCYIFDGSCEDDNVVLANTPREAYEEYLVYYDNQDYITEDKFKYAGIQICPLWKSSPEWVHENDSKSVRWLGEAGCFLIIDEEDETEAIKTLTSFIKRNILN